MWVEPAHRGKGYARRLLAAAEEVAAELGHERLRLDTWAGMTEAQGLYRRAGYQEIDDYNGNPYSSHWFEKRLR